MARKIKQISLVVLVFITLLIVGLVPLITSGWLLSDRSAKELRAVEGRYQTQLVQDKARQIEMFGQRYCDLVGNYARALELTNDNSLLSSPQTQVKISQILAENPNLLSFSVKPITGEPLNVFRSEGISLSEIDKLSSSALTHLDNKNLVIGQPRLIQANQDIAMAIASPVRNEGQIVAAVVTVISLNEIGRLMSEGNGLTEKELWDGGLPLTFVIDESGRAISYPDSNVVAQQQPLTNLKIVGEWQESRGQIQSALVPFVLNKDGEDKQMIGAYSSANINDELHLGVIAMQREDMALASVREMKIQTWLISLGFAVIALAVGYLFARQLTNPILDLVAAAKRITEGDLSTRIESHNINEIDTLGSTFNSMSSGLEENINKLALAAQENRELFVGTVKALSAAIDGKDRYTRGHSERVSRISVAIGQRLKLSDEDLEKLRISALLHDVGKIAIDDNILKKPSALTDEEYEIMKTHPQKGYKIMSQIPAMKDFLPGMYMHHEMINGQGYPQGLKDNEIPLQAKIVSVADTFDAMTTDRPYQKGMNLDDAISRIGSFVGSRYDGRVVSALVQACVEGQIGIGTVKLRTNTEDVKAVKAA